VRSPNRLALVLAIAALILLGAACSSSASTLLQGSGSTFQAQFNEEVISALEEVSREVEVTYAGGGSGKGKTDLQNLLVDFAGTDSIIKDSERAAYKGGEVLYVPTVAAPIAVAFNVSGLDRLNLSPDTLGQIFQGDITKWNDDAIQADNPDATLPSADIKVVRRADSSGTSDAFTKYLKAAYPAFAIEPGSTPRWPAGFSAQQGNSGVAQSIKGSNGTIGYVDYAETRSARLNAAAIKNKSGSYIAPSLPATEAALAAVELADDLTYDPLNAEGAEAYPIVASTYIIVYARQPDAETAEALRDFLTFVLTEGQDLADEADFSRLPPSLRARALDQLQKITVG
jgi:phosphate transport system substrate-binding protein